MVSLFFVCNFGVGVVLEKIQNSSGVVSGRLRHRNKKEHEIFRSASLSGGNLVDGLPCALHCYSGPSEFEN